jgi:hypothetical protein
MTQSRPSSSAGARLSPATKRDILRPWKKAAAITECNLYWLPVSSFPVSVAQRQWLLAFFDRFSEVLELEFGLRLEVFLQMKTFLAVREKFLETAGEFGPLMGLSRRPGAPLPALPTEKDLELMKNGRKQFDMNEYSPDYCYWFVYKAGRRQREEFLGYAGLTMVFLKPDEKSKPPTLPFSAKFRSNYKIFQLVDVDKFFAGAFAMADSFLAKSKALFGKGLENSPQYQGLQFVLPLLTTKDFFEQPPDSCHQWFDVFDLYINESASDKGLLMATKLDIEAQLAAILKQMTEDGLLYPER